MNIMKEFITLIEKEEESKLPPIPRIMTEQEMFELLDARQTEREMEYFYLTNELVRIDEELDERIH